MPIPKTRGELVRLIETEFQKLYAELQDVDAELANEICVDDWSIKDLLAVRLWWTQGYRWKETPRLNTDIISKSRSRSHKSIVVDLRRQYSRLLATVDGLKDKELLEIGAYKWAGRYPISRWLSINTARQYHTARTYVRRVKMQLDRGQKRTYR